MPDLPRWPRMAPWPLAGIAPWPLQLHPPLGKSQKPNPLVTSDYAEKYAKLFFQNIHCLRNVCSLPAEPGDAPAPGADASPCGDPPPPPPPGGWQMPSPPPGAADHPGDSGPYHISTRY